MTSNALENSSEFNNEDEDNINEVDEIVCENKEYDDNTDDEYFESMRRKKGRPITSKATLHKNTVDTKETKKMKEMIAAMKTKNAKQLDKALEQKETEKKNVDEQKANASTKATNMSSKTDSQVAAKTLNLVSSVQSVDTVSSVKSPPGKLNSPSGGNKGSNSMKSILDKGDNLSVDNILNLQSQLMQPTLPTRSVQGIV